MKESTQNANCPASLPAARPRAALRTSPEDFIVQEIPAYEASGRGEHLFVTFEKRAMNTIAAIETLSRIAECDARHAGRAGLKDRHAVTTQTVSLPVAMAEQEQAIPRLLATDQEGLKVLAVKAHDNKLKPGHLRGNRFTITLRELDGAAEALAEQFDPLAHVPNHFGTQRFGRGGDNADRALSWLKGEWKGPRQRGKQKLLFSALQSKLFNQVLDERIANGTASGIIDGDLVKKYETGGMFVVESTELEQARERAKQGELCATGPMFGIKMRFPERQALAIERAVLEQAGIKSEDLKRFKRAGAGSRRPLLLPVSDRKTKLHGPDVLTVSFVLPKGGYATTVLSQICDIDDRTRTSTEPESHTHQNTSPPTA